MKKFSLIFTLVLLLGLSLTYFFPKDKDKVEATKSMVSQALSVQRWYSPLQVTRGKEVFANNCASCHGYSAEKTLNWKQSLSDGSYPPPPLNDKAHAWHHPYSQLLTIINNGGKAYGGKMPSFKAILKDHEKEDSIAYFQSFWSDKIYEEWVENGGLKDKKVTP